MDNIMLGCHIVSELAGTFFTCHFNKVSNFKHYQTGMVLVVVLVQSSGPRTFWDFYIIGLSSHGLSFAKVTKADVTILHKCKHFGWFKTRFTVMVWKHY